MKCSTQGPKSGSNADLSRTRSDKILYCILCLVHLQGHRQRALASPLWKGSELFQGPSRRTSCVSLTWDHTDPDLWFRSCWSILGAYVRPINIYINSCTRTFTTACVKMKTLYSSEIVKSNEQRAQMSDLIIQKRGDAVSIHLTVGSNTNYHQFPPRSERDI